VRNFADVAILCFGYIMLCYRILSPYAYFRPFSIVQAKQIIIYTYLGNVLNVLQNDYLKSGTELAITIRLILFNIAFIGKA